MPSTSVYQRMLPLERSKPSPEEKTALNALATSLNVAQPLYQAYHSGQATEAQAQTAVNDVSAKQASVQALGVN